jgi:hypothetical protein
MVKHFFRMIIFLILILIFCVGCPLQNTDASVRFHNDSGEDRRLGVGTDADHILVDSGIIADGTTTAYYDIEEGSYHLFNYLGNWVQDTGPWNVEAGKDYEVDTDGAVSLVLYEIN